MASSSLPSMLKSRHFCKADFTRDEDIPYLPTLRCPRSEQREDGDKALKSALTAFF
jgi:hypothetical protein